MRDAGKGGMLDCEQSQHNHGVSVPLALGQVVRQDQHGETHQVTPLAAFSFPSIATTVGSLATAHAGRSSTRA